MELDSRESMSDKQAVTEMKADHGFGELPATEIRPSELHGDDHF
jgi:hypothetical protein